MPTPRTKEPVTSLALWLPQHDSGELDGPWVQAFWFAMHGEVRSKANHRAGDRRNGKSAWEGLRGFERAVFAAARAARPAGWDPGDKSDPVAVRPAFVVFCYARSLLDVGNLDKSLLDAVQGPVMYNDTQVRWSSSAGVRVTADPGFVLAVARVEPDSDLADHAAAAAELSRQVIALLTTPASGAVNPAP